MLGLLLSATPGCHSSAATRFENFESVSALNLMGDAATMNGVLRLTPAKGNKTGAAWLREKQVVRSGFDATFQFQLTHQDRLFFHGADGFAFVVQNSGPEAIGGRGSAAGFGMPDPSNPEHPGIPRMIAVFFDTCQNRNEKDTSSNSIAVRGNGAEGGMRWPAARLAFTPALKIQMKDRKAHTAHIVFDPPLLSVFLDGSAAPVLKTPVDFSFAVDHEGRAWVGFTAATGFGYENHDILNWSFGSETVSSSMSVVTSDIAFPMSNCLPGYNLCTPEKAIVQPKGGGFHVIMPANLEWGVSVPNPSGRSVTIANAHGVSCWDLKAPGAEGCGNPSGHGMHAGEGFLVEDAAAGALVTKTLQGQTLFSVNGRKDVGFKDNEGFYEFDVEIK